MQEEKAYSVTQINKYIKAVLDEDYILQEIRIQGEISNYSRHSSGHAYFTLKDEESAISCVMFAKEGGGFNSELKNGMLAIVTGSVGVYIKNGQYQIYVKKIEHEGKGDLHLKFEELKNRLLNEGLFESKYKKQIPYDPKIIAIITSPTGAAVKDIISVARRRNKTVKLAVFPVLVQGEQAAETIAQAINDVNALNYADVIIVGRGGGSIEDLWAFNEEAVARAIFNSKIPVISAVGHETDFTIADFTADVRAATPSVSAEIAIPLLRDKKELVEGICRIINQSMARLLQSKEASLAAHRDKIMGAMAGVLREKQRGLDTAVALLEAVSPLSVLKRGYTVTYLNEAPVKSVEDVQPGHILTTAVADGEIISRVEEVRKL